jgi:ABC-type Zn uptake system ZnuABC Zn-binding protein ZnuA
MRAIGRAAVLAAVVAVVAACTGGSTASPSGPPTLTVVTSTTVFADMVAQVGGSLVNVHSLVPANGDVHTFSPRPSDIRQLAAAKLVVMNGLGLDDWLLKSISAVNENAPVVQLAPNLPGVEYITGDEGSGPPNPHLWLDPVIAQLYVDRIESGLAQADPANAAAYDRQAAAYRARLGELDTWVQTQIATIPPGNRRFVAFHDAFPYYARAYGLEIVGVAVAAPGQDPSAGYTAQLIAAIKAAHVKAIFSEAQFPPKLVDQLAQQTGATVVATLYDDSIGNPPITTYEAIVRWDTQQFVTALR